MARGESPSHASSETYLRPQMLIIIDYRASPHRNGFEGLSSYQQDGADPEDRKHQRAGGSGEKGTCLRCWRWGCRLWNTCPKVRLGLPYGPAIPLQGPYPQNTHVEKGLGVEVWRQPGRLVMGDGEFACCTSYGGVQEKLREEHTADRDFEDPTGYSSWSRQGGISAACDFAQESLSWAGRESGEHSGAPGSRGQSRCAWSGGLGSSSA